MNTRIFLQNSKFISISTTDKNYFLAPAAYAKITVLRSWKKILTPLKIHIYIYLKKLETYLKKSWNLLQQALLFNYAPLKKKCFATLEKYWKKRWTCLGISKKILICTKKIGFICTTGKYFFSRTLEEINSWKIFSHFIYYKEMNMFDKFSKIFFSHTFDEIVSVLQNFCNTWKSIGR